MACIKPESLAGGTAFSASFSAGYGTSPSSTTIRFASEDGTFGTPKLSLTDSQQVGVTGALREQVPVKYTIDQGPGGSVMTVTFQDKKILDLSRKFIVLNDPDINIPGGACVFPLGEKYHKPLGAPGVTDETTLRKGPAPKIKEGNSWRLLGDEFIFYSPRDLTGAAGNLISGALKGVIHGGPQLLNKNGQSILSIVGSIAQEEGVELYANSQGQLDVRPEANGATINVGKGCGITSVTSSGDLTCTKAVGGFVTYKHKDQYRDTKKQTFKSVDLLGLPVLSCAGETKNLYKEDMSEQDAAEMSRALKAGWLDESWNNWEGFSTYIHLKRLSDGAENAASDDDKVPLFMFPGRDDVWGQDIPNKEKIVNKCAKVGEVPAKKSDKVKPNGTIDTLFDCLKPLLLDLEKAEPLKYNKQILSNVTELDATATNAKIDPELLQLIIVGTKEKLKCDGGQLNDDGELFYDVNVENTWAQGANADYANILGEFAKTVGRFWVMTGGGAGGGAGTITQRQNQLRTYELPGKGSLLWYHPDTDVRDTVFREVYEALYAKFIKDANEDEGVIVNQEAVDELGAEPVRKPAKHLSISQFLQLAAEGKAKAIKGENADPGKAIGEGKGKTNDELASEAEDLEERCNRNEPKGILIWDKEMRGLALPEQDDVMKSMAGGLEPYNDRNGNDITKFLIEQLDIVSAIDPTKKGNGEKPEGAKNDGDVMDFSLDAYVPHEDWFPGESRSRSINYTELEPREHYTSRANYPPCDSAYDTSVVHEDISGQVLWKKVDCLGNILPWTEDFKQHGQVSNAMNRKLATMTKQELAPCLSSQITACGSEPAQMPGGGATQDFSVSFGEDGSVTTTFTVSGSESRIAAQNLNAHNFKNPGGGGRAGDIINKGPAMNDPMRGLRNPRTRR